MGIKNVALAINKMDLVQWSEDVFKAIEQDYRVFAKSIGIDHVTTIPVSALKGDNIINAGSNAPWYNGPTLLEWLEGVRPNRSASRTDFVMPVQWVNRPNPDFRGFSGRISSGTIYAVDRIRVSPSGRESVIKTIISGDSEIRSATQGQSVRLVLHDEIDISRGDVIASSSISVPYSDQFEADLIWMHERHALPGRSYAFQIHCKAIYGHITDIKCRFDINQASHIAAKTLELNEIGVVTLAFDRPTPFLPYEEDPTLGAFIVIDRITNETVGAGMIRHALRRAENIHTQALDVTKETRSNVKLQKPMCLWFTGLSGSGKLTIANLLEKKLIAEGKHTYILDGDNIRHGLNKDLGFTEADRVENIRRVAEVAKLMVDAGLIVLVAFISPFREDRAMARRLFDDGEFVEIFVDTPLDVCEKRDVKGLYAKARRGEIKNFTGIDSAYEAPGKPEIRIETSGVWVEQAVEVVLNFMRAV